MKKIFLIFLLFINFSFILFLAPKAVFSDELDDITKKINDLQNSLNESKKSSAPLENQLKNMQSQITGIENRVSFITRDILNKKEIINKGYAELGKQKDIFNKTVRDYYIKNYLFSPFLVFISSNDAASITRSLTYQKKGANQDKAIITNIAIKITDLEEQKKNLEEEEAKLVVVKSKLDSQKVEVEKLVSGARTYQASLTSQIEELSAKQRDILAQKLGSLNIPLYAYNTQGGCSSDLTNGKDPGFSGGIGFFSFGVPNRVGLNQYGAKGRAEAGQNSQQILSAYYSADYTTGYDTGVNIHVTGTNEYGQSFDDNWTIEEYLKHIYEVPTNWPSEVLKAQAIAARSYALATTNNGANSICPSQSCQVVKREENSDAWKKAVNDTAGIVLTSGGQPIKAWFSSTHGGYVYTSSDIGWNSTPYTKRAQDTTSSVSNFSDLKNNAYDKNSPWFYCDWGARSAYGGTAWLKGDEVADIVNTILLVQEDSATKEHLYQTDKPNPAGTDTWDQGRVKSELKGKGVTPFNSVSSISVNADFGSGKTTSVNVSGDAGSRSFSGDDFKNRFNLRAPSNIQIVGPLYNIETK